VRKQEKGYLNQSGYGQR